MLCSHLFQLVICDAVCITPYHPMLMLVPNANAYADDDADADESQCQCGKKNKQNSMPMLLNANGLKQKNPPSMLALPLCIYAFERSA